MPDRAEIGETAMADAEWWMCHDVLVQVAGRLRDGRPLGILTGAGVSIESGVPSAGGVVALLERHGLVTDRGLAYQDAMASAFPTDHERGGLPSQHVQPQICWCREPNDRSTLP